ncbi:orotidine-5'-phosphate decarboxylase [Hugenholtzia roseola]|uniref:orotidine-5'-phosphate decarboxylase n=1 Tax=Hugenholtzia roseola TaxID=1002 RepID=UPI0004213DE3|nr:orotidine-5'-phosphate decarboxylase [Hugenholtzia roseola]
MQKAELIQQIHAKKSFLCVGLDTDLYKLPKHYAPTPDSILDFNKKIIEATLPFAVSYKINTAFYEALGKIGWEILHATFEMLPAEVFKIADAKRGDIGNTSNLYARAFFEQMKVDALTVAPYMGYDSIAPFLAYSEKWTILLGLTSNAGAADFELQKLENGDFLYENVIKKAQSWGNPSQLMFVVGATQKAHLQALRALAPDSFFLVPGVGAQGGELASVVEAALTAEIGLLINSSRQIIYADSSENFAAAAAQEAQKLQMEMAKFI